MGIQFYNEGNGFNWEKFYAGFFAVLFILMPLYIKDMIQFEEFCRNRQGCQSLGINFLYYSLLAALVLYIVKTIVRYLTYSWVSNNIRLKYVGKDKELRTKKVCKWIYDIIYYSSTTIFSIICFYDEDWFPYSKNYNVRDTYVINNWPSGIIGKYNLKISDYVTFFYIVQHGNHIYSLIDLIFVRRKEETKFFEWLLHHYLACCLILYSGYMNQQRFGILVLMVHDIADIFVAFFKAYSEVEKRNEAIFYINVVNMELFWFVTRLYLFPTRCIIPSFLIYRSWEGPEWDITSNCYIYLQIQMIVLYFMHVYWFGIMVNMTYSQISKIIKNKSQSFHNDFDFSKEVIDNKSKKN